MTARIGCYSRSGWAEFDRRWNEIANDALDPLLGVARLYLARVHSDNAAKAHPSADLAAAIRPLLPFATHDSDWWKRAFRADGGLALWEPSPFEDARIERRIIVVAAENHDAALSAWTWSRGDEHMPPFARYLLHAAKIRYQVRVHDQGKRIRDLRGHTEGGIGKVDPDSTATLEERLSLLHTNEADLLDVMTRLRIMQRTVKIAADNMAAVLGQYSADNPDRSVFGDESALANWFGKQLEDDLAYIEAAQHHVRRLGEITADKLQLLRRQELTFTQNSELDGSTAKRSQSRQKIFTGPRAESHSQSDTVDVRRNVFVVYGRDETVRERMFEFMRALDLKPLEWEPLVAASDSTAPFLGDVVQRAPAQAQAAVVLLTPDDLVHLHPDLHGKSEPIFETKPTCQPRPNVLIELGMVLMAYPQRTIIVEIGGLRPIADLAGRNVIRFDGSAISTGKLVERLKSAGCAVDDQGSDWRIPRRFADLDAYDRAPPEPPTSIPSS
ncbi:hypothetical protein Aple_075620 [Acrocarpospora pleiomorpha]|uniref:Uncharacterized protein n=1 Tax=Acrocarpospora pleiomorpha TaxID=90975 RepID=A0A5M3XYX8_9ACTN|nr:hypothetical protein Aple_075620 [Acrocarpospora pleiomorpha]